MTANENCLKESFQSPNGKFSYLDSRRIIKTFHDQNESYLIVRKNGLDHHLLAYDHEKDQMVLKDEVKGVLSSCYPIYKKLMGESLKTESPDFEKIALGICIGMTVYDFYKQPIIYFRNLHTYAFTMTHNFKGKRPLGDPDIPKDNFNLGFIYQTYPRNGVNMYSFDGYVFPKETLEILLYDYGIIELTSEPQIYKNYLTDVWKLKRRP